ncbi:hypothetical protein Lepto7376_3929 [[Leptolyngbya] sp. PCC 7376]|uniref:slr1659 superfamily regulator n=1 Tax=[Leptolyngbya] sp. PCC 7376 TaxID=111781 RepID=UPI00029F2104|nr:hypothetical protein [[Leptolyngbya] sp. PCC 7376]AFY40078.1 hypothetical protein Lepto7376_3929 [[Leptolyngbya] sp. PCC 7376]
MLGVQQQMINDSDGKYKVYYEEEDNIVVMEGSLRLIGAKEYEPISSFLKEIIQNNSDLMTINLEKLKFLNSSGISTLSKFVIFARKKDDVQMKIVGSQSIPWQKKSLKNLTRLMPSLILELK